MSVKATLKEDGKLELLLDNGDLTKMREVLDKWNFKNEQTFLRFVVSLLTETEDKELWIKSDGVFTKVEPADHSIGRNIDE